MTQNVRSTVAALDEMGKREAKIKLVLKRGLEILLDNSSGECRDAHSSHQGIPYEPQINLKLERMQKSYNKAEL